MSIETLYWGLGIAIAGGLGAVLRFIFSAWGGKLPWGILVANILASFLGGCALLAVQYAKSHPESITTAVAIYALLGIGFAGGLSTFSSFAAQAGQMFLKKQRIRLVSYFVMTLLLPIVAVILGINAAAALIR